MKRVILTSLFAIFFFSGIAQKYFSLSGLVKDSCSGEPLIGASIQLLPQGKGISTDAYGFYSIEVPEKTVVVEVRYVGYKAFRKSFNINKNTQADIPLSPGIELNEVVVSSHKHVEDRMEIGLTELPVSQVENMPVFGEPDVLKAMQLLPGVQGGSDGRTGLYVRGGSPDQNLFMLDGTPLYYVNHIGGFVSAFHPAILKNIKLYKGGFPSRFGGRLSSIVDLRMKEGNKKEFHGSYGIGVISGDFTIEGPIQKDKTSFILSYRRVWFDLFTRPITYFAFKGSSMGYNFYDMYGKISHEIDNNNRLYFSFYGGEDRLGYFYKDSYNDNNIRSKAKYDWGNILSTIRWNRVYSPKLNSDITLYYTRYQYKTGLYFRDNDDKEKNVFTTALHDFGLKADYNAYVSNAYVLRFGGGISGNWFKPGQINYYTKSTEEVTDTTLGTQNNIAGINSFAYVENEVSLSKWASFNAGARLTNFYVDSKNYFSVEPRLLLKFKSAMFGAIKFGYTKMNQPVHMLTYSGSSFPTDLWLPSTNTLKPSSSQQYAIGYSKSIKNGVYEFSLELYTKTMNGLIDIKGGVPLVNGNNWEDNVEKNGKGTSKGIEFLLQKKYGKTTGWISYTLSKAERTFKNIDNGKPYPFKYDRRHDLSVVVSHKLKENIVLSGTWLFGSGYPTTLSNGTYLAIQPQGYNLDSYQDNLFYISDYRTASLYPGRNWLTMKAYHRLDLGVNFNKKKMSIKGNTKLRTWTIGVYNAYNSKNPVFYYYGRENGSSGNPIRLYQQNGFPIIPTVKYSIKF